ncbi:MAG: CPBP family intramembrane metalloprotease [Leptospirales bacterium]|nr:CPBP family intramembrane metalloprotease [Leptospirales bacterium]
MARGTEIGRSLLYVALTWMFSQLVYMALRSLWLSEESLPSFWLERLYYLISMPLCGALLLHSLHAIGEPASLSLKDLGSRFPDRAEWQKSALWRQAMAALAAALALSALIFFEAYIRRHFGWQPSTAAANRLRDLAQSGVGALHSILLAGILITPLLEEVFYRLLLQRSLQASIGAWSILLPAGLFALAHPAAVWPELLGAGLCFGFLFWRYGPAATILAHALYNALVLIGEFWGGALLR